VRVLLQRIAGMKWIFSEAFVFFIEPGMPFAQSEIFLLPSDLICTGAERLPSPLCGTVLVILNSSAHMSSLERRFIKLLFAEFFAFLQRYEHFAEIPFIVLEFD